MSESRNIGDEKWTDYYWYHCIDLGSGIVTDGDYDMERYIPFYKLPGDMRGMSVLDVGRASGAFAFEFERRGATVVATDIRSYLDWDFVGGELQKEERRLQIVDAEAFSRKHIFGAFEYARRLKRSKVEGQFINVYQISPAALGDRTFDLVFAGSITSHLRDPILAMERLRSVTKGVCVIAAPTLKISGSSDFPIMALVGTSDSDRRSWWVISAKCLKEMLYCAGFRSVEIVSEFTLRHRKIELSVDHVVVHATA